MSFSEKNIIQPLEQESPNELEIFEHNRRKPETYADYQVITEGRPAHLFEKENMGKMRALPIWKRTLFIGAACNDLWVTPEALHRYFQDFPEDRRLLIEYLEKNGFESTGFTHHITSVLAPELEESEVFNDHPLAWKYKSIASKRNKAPAHLLTGFKQVHGANFTEFGEAAHGFFDAMEASAEIKNRKLPQMVDSKKVFNTKYQDLPETDKVSFLKKCLAELQFSMVFEEVYNSDSFHLGQLSHSILTEQSQSGDIYDKPESKQLGRMQGSRSIEGINFFPHEYLSLSIIKELGKFPEQAAAIIPFLIEFWVKNQNPLFTQAVAESLSNLDAHQASLGLLKQLRDKKNTQATSAVLFRIEIGKIGISAKGADYLGKLYDLGTYNNPDFQVERLTALGDVGIFDEQRKLLGYFQLGNITSDETVIKAEVLEITKDLLFHLTGNETPEEIAEREAILYEFITHYHEFFGKDWLTESDIRFNNLSFGEQGWLMQYVKQQQWVNSPEKIKRDQSFFKAYGETGIKTFLALEQGMQGDKIVDIGLLLPRHLAEQVFQRYSDIVGSAENISQHLSESLALNIDSKTQNKIAQKLLKRAKDLLVDFSDKASRFDEARKPAQNQPDDSEKIYSDLLLEFDTALRNVRIDIELLVNTFRTLRENDVEFSLEDFEESTTTTEFGADIPSKESNHMRELYLDSMLGYPEKTKLELIKKFDTHLIDKKNVFSILRYKGEIAGFLCFTETKPGQKYVSAVTLDPRFQKAYIGETMIDEAFAREAESNILGADCVAQKSVSARYIENGFIGVRSWDDNGDLIMDIVRDDVRNEKYFSTKSLSQKEIVRLAPIGKIGTARVEVMADPKEHSFALCNEGFVLTRYFKDKATNKWYLVYEPKPSKTKENTAVTNKEEALA